MNQEPAIDRYRHMTVDELAELGRKSSTSEAERAAAVEELKRRSMERLHREIDGQASAPSPIPVAPPPIENLPPLPDPVPPRGRTGRRSCLSHVMLVLLIGAAIVVIFLLVINVRGGHPQAGVTGGNALLFPDMIHVMVSPQRK